MKAQRIKKIMDEWHISINRHPCTPLVPFPYCCVCYEALTFYNVTVEDDHLVDVCKTCTALEEGMCSPIQHQNCSCFHCGPLPK